MKEEDQEATDTIIELNGEDRRQWKEKDGQ